jgi:hypothetical protein
MLNDVEASKHTIDATLEYATSKYTKGYLDERKDNLQARRTESEAVARGESDERASEFAPGARAAQERGAAEERPQTAAL